MSDITTTVQPRLPRGLECMLDIRLAAVERSLAYSGTSRAQRQVVSDNLEADILLRLSQLNSGTPTKSDMLSVLGELGPPEAYMAELLESEPVAEVANCASPKRPMLPGRSGVWGGFLLSAMCVLLPHVWLVAILTNSAEGSALTWLLSLSLMMQLAALVAEAFAIYFLAREATRHRGGRTLGWACVVTMPFNILATIFITLCLIKSGLQDGFLAIIFWVSLVGAAPHGVWLGVYTWQLLLELRRESRTQLAS